MINQCRWKLEVETQTRYDSITGEKRESVTRWIKSGDGEVYLALIHPEGDDIDSRAALIAAAPEMLEALIEAFHAINEGDVFNKERKLEVIKAAIAKAEGRS